MYHLLTIDDFRDEDIFSFMELASRLKRERGFYKDRPLAGKSVGLVFSKSSTRTRVSFEVGITELGGYPIYMNQKDLQLGTNETVHDTAKTLSRYLHAVIIRTYAHKEIEEFARNSTIPIINALTNEHHPCQAIADLLTIYEITGSFENIRMTYIGDGASNMASSLIMAAKYSGMELTVCAPKEYAPLKQIMKMDLGPGKVTWEKNPSIAVKMADFIYTDVWVSMGFEAESSRRITILNPYQLNSELMKKAPADVKIMHCLPAHRGLEITDDVIDGPNSIVFVQAENRLHAQKAILCRIFGQNS